MTPEEIRKRHLKGVELLIAVCERWKRSLMDTEEQTDNLLKVLHELVNALEEEELL